MLNRQGAFFNLSRDYNKTVGNSFPSWTLTKNLFLQIVRVPKGYILEPVIQILEEESTLTWDQNHIAYSPM